MSDAARVAERHQRLWIVPASPLVWTVHFLLCYVSAAIWCAKIVHAQDSLAPVRLAIAAYTIAAVVAIAAVGWMGYRDHRRGAEPVPHDADSQEDRHRFLGYATLLLSGLSLVATLYTAIVALFFTTCE